MIQITTKMNKTILTGIFIIFMYATGINYAIAQRISIVPTAGSISTNPNPGSIWVNRDTVFRNYTPTQLVNDVFVNSGGCASVSNVTLTTHGWNSTTKQWTSNTDYDLRGLGYFSRGTSNFEMESGIVMSTGGLISIEGPNGSSDGITYPPSTAPNFNSPYSNPDPDLQALIPGYSQTNYTVLEFDFVPISNTVTFRYIFASEEYLEWVNSQYNDVFGFFISGPGINGSYANNAVNIASLPNGGIVSINNVNWGSVSPALHNCANSSGAGSGSANPSFSALVSNPQYYMNTPGSFSTCASSLTPADSVLMKSMEFDGRTVLLTATTPLLQPCQTYHIKLAVGNAGDTFWQSGVFLEAKSFNMGDALVNYGNGIKGMDYVYKGCTENHFVLPRGTSNNTAAEDFPLIYGGSAVNGIDVSLPGGGALPELITIPAGQDSVEVYYTVNASAPGPKTFTITTPCICGGYQPPKIIYIFDPAVFQITSTSTCSNVNTGSIKINLVSGNSNAYRSSIDGGTTWNYSKLEYTGLTSGTYTVLASDSGSCFVTTRDVLIGAGSVVWTPEINTGSDTQNWNNTDNWTPATIPVECDTVYIPGNSINYPLLAGHAACKDIYFVYGAELGRPDYLSYQRAFVQYDFGLEQSTQTTNRNDKTLVLSSNPTTANRMLYSASVSSEPMQRERWYMLSAPLKSIATGDFDLGGFPLTFLEKFGPVVKDTKNYPIGSWTVPYNTMIEPVSLNVTDGFAFYMYGYGAGSGESGSFNDLNDLTYMSYRNGKNYGLKLINGILELPFFADSTNLYAHRTQVYNQPVSTFYYIDDGVRSPSNFNMLTGRTESLARNANNENYRFAPETYNGANWVFPAWVDRPLSGFSDGDDFLVGNPFMSSINMIKFCTDNATSIYPSFRIWNGLAYDDYTVDTSTGTVTSTKSGDNSPYISPLQGFLLTYKGSSGSGNVRFNVASISTVRPPVSTFDLRSDQETKEVNILRIKAENNTGASCSVIGYKDKASNGFVRGEDVQKLFSPFNDVPEIYSLAGDIPVDINFISGDVMIPLGIKTGQTGVIRLTFTGMDNYSKTSKITFTDALLNTTVDLTGKSNYTYSFNATEKGILNGRFSLRMGNSPTSLPDINSFDELKVYKDLKVIYVVSSEPVQKIEIYDFAGRKLYESKSGAKYYPLPDNLTKSPLIVKVMTKDNAKTVKIN